MFYVPWVARLYHRRLYLKTSTFHESWFLWMKTSQKKHPMSYLQKGQSLMSELLALHSRQLLALRLTLICVHLIDGAIQRVDGRSGCVLKVGVLCFLTYQTSLFLVDWGKIVKQDWRYCQSCVNTRFWGGSFFGLTFQLIRRIQMRIDPLILERRRTYWPNNRERLLPNIIGGSMLLWRRRNSRCKAEIKIHLETSWWPISDNNSKN